MPLDLSQTLVVGISSTALFDLTEADRFFRSHVRDDSEKAVALYRQYMLEREEEDLADGTGMPLVEALLRLNTHRKDTDPPLVEVVVMSRNSPETGVRVLNNVRRRQLAISRYAFTGGGSVVAYLDAFDVDLFLTTDVSDAQAVIDAQTSAAAILRDRPTEFQAASESEVRIAFDADAVLFDDASELIYKSEGLDRFHAHENERRDDPLEEGPYAVLLKKLAKLQQRLPSPVEFSPVRIAVVTARNAPAEMRVIKTLRNWGVYVNEMLFLGGLEKAKFLKAFNPHIFFDDQELHLAAAARVVPSAKVPIRSNSQLKMFEER
ncbi:MAG: 5'-nucleotidase [Bdellovibrionales bacterium]|nr:5'-nucleotidase [Bdellovibrionales bacterium]